MVELLSQYSDSAFIDAVLDLSPAVGVGLILGIIFWVIGSLYGFVIRLGKVDDI